MAVNNSTRGSRSSWFNAFDNATSAPSMVMDSALLNESIFYSINSTASTSTDPTTLFENFRDESRFWIQRVKLQFFSFFFSFLPFLHLLFGISINCFFLLLPTRLVVTF